MLPIINPIVKVTNNDGTYTIQLVMSASDPTRLMVTPAGGMMGEARIADYEGQYTDLLNLIVRMTPLKYDVTVVGGDPVTTNSDRAPVIFL